MSGTLNLFLCFVIPLKKTTIFLLDFKNVGFFSVSTVDIPPYTTVCILKGNTFFNISMHLITFVNGVLLVGEFVISTYNGNGSFYVLSTHLSGFLDGSQSRGSCKM